MVLMFPYYADPIRDSLLKLIPSLVAGNCVLLKSPPNFPHLAEYLSAHLLPLTSLPNLLCDLYIHSTQTPEVIKFRQIRQITFTGSHSSGKHIFEQVAAERFIDCNLFFGSKDAAYIDETANIEQAVREIVKAGFENSGQSIGALKRLYVKEEVAEEVLARIVEEVGKIKIGNPLDPQTDMGPLCMQENVLQIAQLIE